MANPTLIDLAALNRTDSYTGLVEDVTTLAPEFSTFSAHARSGWFYEVVRRIALPTAQFRITNAGVNTSKSTYKKDVKEMFYIDTQLQIDEAIWKADPGNVGSIWMNEAAGAMRSASILIGQQTYYGTSADAAGFVGIRSQLAYTIAAGGTTSSTSAYLCNMDAQQGCRYDVGMDGQFAISAPQRQQVVDTVNSGKTYFAYVGNLNAWVGYNQISNLSSWAVTGVTTTQAQWLTDSFGSQLLAKIPMARRGNLRWFINRTAASTLQRARSTVNIGIVASNPTASYQAAGADGRPAFSPLPDNLVGYPITVTDSILDTETNS